MPKPIVWTIAGSDASAGAGIQADLLTVHAFACHPATVITASTAQNSCGIADIYYLPADNIIQQLRALQQDLPAAAIKIGMLGNAATTALIFAEIEKLTCPIVLDPLLQSSSGSHLHQADTQQYLAALQRFFPKVTLLTPNISEAEALVGGSITSFAEMKAAATKILAMGVQAVLIKGGHLAEGVYSQDYWSNGQEECWLSQAVIVDKQVHGTGCILSAAVAAGLAQGYGMLDALVLAKAYVTQAIRNAQQIGQGFALPAHLGWPQAANNLPYLTAQPLRGEPITFPDCAEKIAIYPIVDSRQALAVLCNTGIHYAQLRIKNSAADNLEQEIQDSIALARRYRIRLFINDYWQLAIKHGAYGVHLGQEDLLLANMDDIRRAGLRLGISTHSYAELARAAQFKPSYIALGPIYPTLSKVMHYLPQGVQNLRYWRNLLTCPLVAIGGIDVQQLAAMAGAGADGVAVISAISKAADPAAKTKHLLQAWRQLTAVL